MKIISKFHDYYDSAASFYDDSILLKRKTEIIDKNEKVLIELAGIIEQNTSSTEETSASSVELVAVAEGLKKIANKFKTDDNSKGS